MLLRHQCRALLSRSSHKTIYSNPPCFPLNPRRCLATNPPPDLSDIQDPSVEETVDADVRTESPFDSEGLGGLREQVMGEREPQISKDGGDRGGKRSLSEIDRQMSVAELGLNDVRRVQKREFMKWLIQEGQEYEYFPQHVVMDVEERRVEKARIRAEKKMFACMNAFFNSLTLEEIQTGQLSKEESKRKSRVLRIAKKGRPSKQSVSESQPSSLERLMNGEIATDLTPKQIESKVLSLLKQSDPKLHQLYKNYIDWSDYQIQKRTLWFSFPDLSTHPAYAGVIGRILGPEGLAAEGKDIRASQLREIEEPTIGAAATDADKTEEPPSEARVEETTQPIPERDGDDLAYYYGPRLDPQAQFPVLGFQRTHYLEHNMNPFPMNPEFQPWRPLPHRTRLQMFNAWRAGLGMRNVAWLGGVSWRRVDAVVGIMKREWNFVKQGGELESEMAEYMESLLAQTPLVKPLETPRNYEGGSLPLNQLEAPQEVQLEEEEHSAHAIPIADLAVRKSAPDPTQPVFIRPQKRFGTRHYTEYMNALERRDKNNQHWEASQKEPLVEVPIKLTKQYFAVIQEMEEYSEKRAAQALTGIDGLTMTEKEDGIKQYLRLFGGLRSLGGRQNFQGTPPWEQELSKKQRVKTIRALKKKARKKLSRTLIVAPTSSTRTQPTPADAFRSANATNLESMPSKAINFPKERVIWRFQDVTWVKQRTTRPRKHSWAGTLDKRALLESGVQRYGPFGIGGGVEGVGGIKQVIERGINGKVTIARSEKKMRKVRREIVV